MIPRNLLPLLLSGCCLLLAACASTDDSSSQDKPRQPGPVRVACCGDSITYGEGMAHRDLFSYPAQLQRKLGTGFDVRNFGVSATSALRNYENAYSRQGAYQNALQFDPDVVVLMLGTNDSAEDFWTTSRDFIRDYGLLAKSFQRTGARVYLVTPPKTWNAEVIPAIRTVAAETGAGLVTLVPGIALSDGVHPSGAGAATIASAIAPYVKTAPIQP